MTEQNWIELGKRAVACDGWQLGHNMNIIDQVTKIAGRKPCAESHDWLAAQPDLEAAWLNCERADWLLWIAGYGGADRRQLVLAACNCAETVLAYVPNGNSYPRAAIDRARHWARKSTKIGDVRDIYTYTTNAYAVSYADAATFAAYAASASTTSAGEAVRAATFAASAAAYANHAASVAAPADASVAAYSAGAAAHTTMCAMIRKCWPTLADALEAAPTT